jgi:hypothetical protein
MGLLPASRASFPSTLIACAEKDLELVFRW